MTKTKNIELLVCDTPTERARKDREVRESLEQTPNLDAALERARTGINLAGIHLLNAEIAATQMEDRARR